MVNTAPLINCRVNQSLLLITTFSDNNIWAADYKLKYNMRKSLSIPFKYIRVNS